MPYYDVQNTTSMDNSWASLTNFGSTTVMQDGKSVITGSTERGFRTRPPEGESVVIVPDNIADPYSYFTTLNEWKQSSYEKLNPGQFGGFQPDKGHPWELVRYKRAGTPMDFIRSAGDPARMTFHGATPSYSDKGMTLTAFPPVPGSTLSSYGALQYGRMATKPGEVSLGTIMGELSFEKLPSLLPATMRGGIKELKGIGDDYLNVQFGWIPLLNSIRDVAVGIASISNGFFGPMGRMHRSTSEKPVSTFDSGRGSSPLSVSVGKRYPDAYKHTSHLGTGSTYSGILYGDVSWTARTTTSRWFEGNFVFLPKAGFDPSKYEDRFQALFATDITPSVLWELAPWSWLVDWVADIGGAIKASEVAFSNRVLSEYAYAMEEVKTKYFFQARKVRDYYGGFYQGPSEVYLQHETIVKRRIRANPFGFTPNPTGSLNSNQLGILAALGLTKLR